MNKSLILLLAVAIMTQTACTQKNDAQKTRARTGNEKVIPGGKDGAPATTPGEKAKDGAATEPKVEPTADKNAKKDDAKDADAQDANEVKDGAKSDKDGTSTAAANTAASDKEKADALAKAVTAAKNGTAGTGAQGDAAGSALAAGHAVEKVDSKADAEAKTSQAQADLKLSDVKVLMVGTLQNTKKGNLLFIADNSLRTEEQGTQEITNIGQGMLCQTQMTKDIANGDILSQTKFYIAPTAVKNVRHMVLVFKNSDKKEMQLDCQVIGDLTERDVQENFEMILDFKDENGLFSKVAEDPVASSLKSRSFKILNMEKFMELDVQTLGVENAKAVVNGKIVPADETSKLVYLRKIRAACQIGNIKGKIDKDVIYKDGDAEIAQSDMYGGVTVLGYTYKAENNPENFISISCISRMKTPANFIFETFKGILEFGADKKTLVEDLNRK